MAGTREALAVLRVDGRTLDKSLGQSRSKFRKFGRQIKKDVGKSIKGAFSGLKTLGGIAIGAGILSAAKSNIELEKSLVRLGIQASRTPKQMGAYRQQLFEISKQTGISNAELQEGVRQFVSLTGKFDEATGSMKTFAAVANASGASMGDISATAAALSQNMGVTAGEMEKAFSVLLTQGKAGAVELKELSTLAAGLTPTFASFNTTGVQGLAELGAMLQVTRRGFGSASEAATGLQGMMIALQKNAKKFKKAGVNIFDPKTGQQRNVIQIAKEIKNLGLNASDTLKLFGRAEGFRAFQQVASAAFDESEDGLDSLIEKGLASKAVQEDSATFLASSAGRMQKSWNDMKLAIAEAFTPQVIEKFADAMEKLADVIKFLVDNPLTALAGLLAIKFGPSALGALFSAGGAVAKGAGGAAAAGAGGGGALAAAAGPIALVAGAGAAGVALGTFVDNATGLSTRLSNLASGEGFGLDTSTQAAREDAGRQGRVGGTGEVNALFKELAQVNQFLTQAAQQGIFTGAKGVTEGGTLASAERANEIKERLQELAKQGKVQERVSQGELSSDGFIAGASKAKRIKDTTAFEKKLIADSKKQQAIAAENARDQPRLNAVLGEPGARVLSPEGRAEKREEERKIRLKVEIENGGLIRITPDPSEARKGNQ